MWRNNAQTERVIIDRLVADGVDPLAATVAASACLAGLLAALLDWASFVGAAGAGGTLGDRIERALAIVAGSPSNCAARTARLELRAVRKMYEGQDGVLGIDLTVESGEIHAIVGLNGAGKSTLMRLALGITTADASSADIDGVAVSAARSTTWAGVGHLLETPLAYPELTVRRNLWLSARLHGLDGPASDATVSAIIAELGLDTYASRRAGRLSLGNRQRVGLAAALQHFPRLVVLDEPSNALEPAGVILLREAIVRRVCAGAGVLISSHHLDEVSRIADREAQR